MDRRRKRRAPEPGEYRDPLSNYDPPPYADDMERLLCEDTAAAIALRPMARVAPAAAVERVLREMAERDVACVVVTDRGRPVGIFSERDVLGRVAECFEEMAQRPIAEVMTPDPCVVYESDPPARVLTLMSAGGFRHVPVVNADGKLVGIIGARRLTAYLQQRLTETR